MDWYYSENNQQHGPVSEDQLANLYRTGTVKGSDLVWCESMSEWTPISKIAAFASIMSGPDISSTSGPSTPSATPTLVDDFPPATPPSTSPSYSPPISSEPQYTPPMSYTPPSGYSSPSTIPGGTPPPNYLWQSIVVTLLCCLPLGIPAIIFSTKVNSTFALGDLAGAEAYSKKAKLWCIIALALGLVINLIIITLQIIAVSSGVMQGIQEGIGTTVQ